MENDFTSIRSFCSSTGKKASIIIKQITEYIIYIYLEPCILLQTAKSAVICCMFDSFNECSNKNTSPNLTVVYYQNILSRNSICPTHINVAVDFLESL